MICKIAYVILENRYSLKYKTYLLSELTFREVIQHDNLNQVHFLIYIFGCLCYI